MKKINVIILGAGSRGAAYAKEMKKMSHQFQVVGVAEPIAERREHLQELFSIPAENCVESWEALLSRPRFADLAVIATQDHAHYEQALKAIDLGYHLLLEKPVAQSAQECIDIALEAEKNGVKVLVCHVLRYTPFYSAIKEQIMAGTLGEIMDIQATEAVGYEYIAHNFVRGDWRSEKDSNPMLLAKCCHDLDIIQWLIGKPCKQVSSFGDLTYFKPENAPSGAPERCVGTECPARESCPYSYDKIYMRSERHNMYRAVARGFAKNFWPTAEEQLEGLRQNEFGNCVFHAGNDVVDHQVVSMQFDGGATATLTMNGFNKSGRAIHIFGTKAELIARFSDPELTVFDFNTRAYTKIPLPKVDETIEGGHGGGDAGIVRELYEYLCGDYKGYHAAEIRTSVNNHLIAFAAEKARHQKTVEDLYDYAKEHHYDYNF